MLSEKNHPSIATWKNLENINAYDIETYRHNDNFIPFCVCFYLNSKYYSFYGFRVIIRSVLKILLEIKEESCIVYVHNLDFDGFLILEEVSKYKKLRLEFLIDKMKIFYLKLSFAKKSIEFRCSKKILPASLKSIAEDFKLPPKLSFPYDFINSNNIYYRGPLSHKNLSWSYIDIQRYTIIYCQRDVEITYKFILKLREIFYKDQKIDLLDSYTISSLSLKTFSKNFNYRRVDLKLKKSIDLAIREGYFGGRVEIFGNTENKVYHYDFPGMYGICMKEKFPFGKPRWVNPSEIHLEKLMPGFYTIEWSSENLRIPILPVKNEYGKLIFPNGHYSGTYWFEEIITFMNGGGKVLDVRAALVYDSYDYVFDDFVEYFNTFRDKGGVYKILGKLIINSLYGKLGSGIKENDYIIAYSKEEFEKIRLNYEVLAVVELNNIFILEVKNKTRISGINVGLASAITSKARIKLFKAMDEIEKKGGRMLYCDTDSLFIDFNSKVDTSIFSWDKADSIYDSAVFALPKTYALKKGSVETIKIKGIPKNSIEFDKFKEKFYNNEFLLFEEVFQTKKNNFTLRAGNIHKEIDLSKYDKRVFNADKSDTRA